MWDSELVYKFNHTHLMTITIRIPISKVLLNALHHITHTSLSDIITS